MTIGTLPVTRARQQPLHSPILALVLWRKLNDQYCEFILPLSTFFLSSLLIFPPRQPLPSPATPFNSSGDLWRQENASTITRQSFQRKLIYLLIYLHPRVSIASSGTLCHQNCCCIRTSANYPTSICTCNSPELFFILPLTRPFVVFFLGRRRG